MRLLWVVVLAAICAAGCSTSSSGAADGAADEVVLRVVAGGEVARDWTLAELEDRVAFGEIDIDGDTQYGPLLSDVIAASGFGDWNSAEVLGMGEGRVIEVVLDIQAAVVDDSWILDVSNRGTLKLAALDLPRERWVRDVGELRFP